ncbi:putative membrane protein YdjX (TVP38/TMEM64 family) [Rhodococcus sp. PvR044]|uniref:TVP38/TMEM64 family protein n=1 Tax=unclassified Rhodococcus (in: high G+C Gram-positive bacteria) TaxID=192944 RepID=UPI001AE888DD|nr:TVP38/TMEM64 family protein [Rhodococcus sp. PvR099]MBP1158681.1 putative membrane protein YdjX (TVP38/TMEM64 family) [Rhodococcus sp. PvR099]
MTRRLRDPKLIAGLLVVAALLVAALLVPHPSIEQVREWARSVGPAFPLVFFAVHALVTVAPVPRTVFTLSAGVLFGAATGILIAVAATTVSAVLALLLVRAVGRDAFASRMTHPAIQAIDDRLARRGWLAVGSLRLIAPVPFSVINYCSGVSSVRLLPYMLATLAGVLPGTIGVVVLGNALGGDTNPALLAFSAVCIAIGVFGLVLDTRMGVPTRSDSVDVKAAH